jgi:hypothetical protein
MLDKEFDLRCRLDGARTVMLAHIGDRIAGNLTRCHERRNIGDGRRFGPWR